MVVGVLDKYVNLGKGWRKRLFVLQRGLLRYYKVGGDLQLDEVVLISMGSGMNQTVVFGSLSLRPMRIRFLPCWTRSVREET